MFNFRRKSSNVDNLVKQCKGQGCNHETEYRDYCWDCARTIMLRDDKKKNDNLTDEALVNAIKEDWKNI